MTVLAFGIVVAVNQIGVAKELVNTLFMGLVAALSLALGLSFGLGGRETAAEIVQTWYRRGQQATPKLAAAADAAKRQAEPGTSGVDDARVSTAPRMTRG